MKTHKYSKGDYIFGRHDRRKVYKVLYAEETTRYGGPLYVLEDALSKRCLTNLAFEYQLGPKLNRLDKLVIDLKI